MNFVNESGNVVYWRVKKIGGDDSCVGLAKLLMKRYRVTQCGAITKEKVDRIGSPATKRPIFSLWFLKSHY